MATLDHIVDTILAPLVSADGGRIHAYYAQPDEVVIELSDACLGCPGFALTRHEVIEPLLRQMLGGDVRIRVCQSARAT